MDELLKVVPFINLFMNTLLIPVVVWVVKIEKKITQFTTIIDLCENCPKPSKRKE